MVLGAFFGAGMGIIGGIAAGSLIFASKDPDSYTKLDKAADSDSGIPEPETGKPIGGPKMDLLRVVPPWVKWPDYERTLWLNLLLKTLWPNLNPAVAKMALEQAKPQLEEVCKKVSVLESIELEVIDIGSRPPTIGGFKVYSTKEDEVIIEAPLLWGSDLRLRVSALVKLGPISVYIPVEVSDIQVRAAARITVKPLVEQLPCVGGVTVTLLEAPHVDLRLALIGPLDLMVLPGIREAVKIAVQKIATQMLVYPNKMSFPIMPNFGLPPKPEGMLVIKVLRAKGLPHTMYDKCTPYVRVQVKAGRWQRTKTVDPSSDPDFGGENVQIVVESAETQILEVQVMDEDMLKDKIVGSACIPLIDAQFMMNPRELVSYSLDLSKDIKAGLLGTAGKMGRSLVRVATFHRQDSEAAAVAAKKDVGKVEIEVEFLPFVHAQAELVGPGTGTEADSDAGPAGPETAAGHAVLPVKAPSVKRAVSKRHSFHRSITRANLKPEMKGVLYVKLTRCINLGKADADVDPYVTLSLYDPAREHPEVHRSSIIPNENCPRWDEKFEFVAVSATSVLTLRVFDKGGMLDGLLSVPGVMKKKQDKQLGSLRLNVGDVVLNRRLKDIWALQETQQGDVSMTLEWMGIELEDESEMAEIPGTLAALEKASMQLGA